MPGLLNVNRKDETSWEQLKWQTAKLKQLISFTIWRMHTRKDDDGSQDTGGSGQDKIEEGTHNTCKEVTVAKCKVCLGKTVRSILPFGGKRLQDELNEYRMSDSFSDADNIIFIIIIFHVFPKTVWNIYWKRDFWIRLWSNPFYGQKHTGTNSAFLSLWRYLGSFSFFIKNKDELEWSPAIMPTKMSFSMMLLIFSWDGRSM